MYETRGHGVPEGESSTCIIPRQVCSSWFIAKLMLWQIYRMIPRYLRWLVQVFNHILQKNFIFDIINKEVPLTNSLEKCSQISAFVRSLSENFASTIDNHWFILLTCATSRFQCLFLTIDFWGFSCIVYCGTNLRSPCFQW